MMQQSDERIVVTTRRVACDGGAGVGGHPKVFLTIPASGNLDCPYCGQSFVLDTRAEAAAGH